MTTPYVWKPTYTTDRKVRWRPIKSTGARILWKACADCGLVDPPFGVGCGINGSLGTWYCATCFSARFGDIYAWSKIRSVGSDAEPLF